MKAILTVTLIAFSTVVYGQFFMGIYNSETWLYRFKKTETFTNEWDVPYESETVTYTIYYAENDYWEFAGELHINSSMSSSKVYFKQGYRVAYGKEDEEPTEILFKTNRWKVE